MAKFRRIWLIVPMWLFLTADVTLTLAGQPPEYWAGDRGAAIEGNPLAYPLVASGPCAFALLAAIWAGLLGAMVVGWSYPWVRGFAIAMALGHAVGGSTWIANLGGVWGWGLAIIYLFAAAEVSRWCWRRSR